jgi:predicted house-cleaning NTP pyrophosphatase (Maf/HAM1 superfamily)
VTSPLYKNLPGRSLVLASSSPRRRELIRSLGIQCNIIPSSVDEEAVSVSPPAELARTLALLKARPGLLGSRWRYDRCR